MDEYKDKYKQHAKEMYEKYGYGFGKPRRSAFDQVCVSDLYESCNFIRW